MSKDEVFELQYPFDSERSPPTDDVGFDPSKLGTVQDDADMRRMGKKQALHVRVSMMQTETQAEPINRGISPRSQFLASLPLSWAPG